MWTQVVCTLHHAFVGNRSSLACILQQLYANTTAPLSRSWDAFTFTLKNGSLYKALLPFLLLPLPFISLYFTAVHCTALYFALLNLNSPRFTSLWVYVLIRLIFTDPWERSAVLHSHSITGVHQLIVGSTEGAVFFLDIRLPCCLLQAVLTMRSFWQQQSI